MDILFENQYRRSKEFYREIHFYSYFGKPLLIAINILLVLAFTFGILSSLKILNHPIGSNKEFFIIFPVFIWVVTIARYIRGVRAQYRQDIETNNGEPSVIKLVFTNDGIDAIRNETEAKTHIPYDKIKKVVNTKHYSMLVTEAKQYIALKKDSFVVGTLNEYYAFLESRGFKH